MRPKDAELKFISVIKLMVLIKMRKSLFSLICFILEVPVSYLVLFSVDNRKNSSRMATNTNEKEEVEVTPPHMASELLVLSLTNHPAILQNHFLCVCLC